MAPVVLYELATEVWEECGLVLLDMGVDTTLRLCMPLVGLSGITGGGDPGLGGVDPLVWIKWGGGLGGDTTIPVPVAVPVPIPLTFTCRFSKPGNLSLEVFLFLCSAAN